MAVDLNDPIMADYQPVEDFRIGDHDHSSTRIRDIPFGKPRQGLGVSPDTLNFSDTAVDDVSAPQTVLLTNTGYEALIIYGASTVGDFVIVGAVPVKILPGETISMQVAFAPRSADAASGGLYIKTSANAQGEEFVTLTGSASGFSFGSGLSDFPTFASAQSWQTENDVDFIRTIGRETAGDGGGMLFGKEVSEPAHSLKIPVIVDGAQVWFGARLGPDKVMHAVQAGVKPGSSAAAINQFLSDAAAVGAREIRFAQDEWNVSGPLIWPNAIKRMDFQGAKLLVPETLGTGRYALEYNNELSLLPGLAANISPVDEVITFSSAHGLAVGDVIGFRNTAVSSLNTWRANYYDGQPAIVREVLSTTQITLWDLIDPRGPTGIYPAATTECFKYPTSGKHLSLANLNVEGGQSPYAGVQITGATHHEQDSVSISGFSYAGLSLDRCVYGVDRNCKFGNFGANTGLQYGRSISNTCYQTSIGLVAYATRHAVAHGGGDGLGAIPSRGNAYFNPKLGADVYMALDFGHGNVLDSRVQGGQIQGVILGGDNNVIDCDVITAPLGVFAANQAIIGTELHGLNHRVRVNRIVVTGNGMSGAANHVNGIIGIGGSSDAMTSKTVHGGLLDYEVGRIEARNWAATAAMFSRFRNRGFTGRWSIRFKVGQIVSPVEANWFVEDHVSGQAPTEVDIQSEPDRFDPSVTPVHGWTGSRGVGGTPVATDGRVLRPILKGSLAHAGATIAAGGFLNIFVTGFVGITFTDQVDFASSVTLGSLIIGAKVSSTTQVAITLFNPTGASVNVPAATWAVYITKR